MAPPQVLVYNEFGYVVTSTQASIVDASASSLTATTPDFTGLLNGSYAVIVGIYDSSGTLQPTLGTSITISGYYTPPDPGGGGGCTTARCIRTIGEESLINQQWRGRQEYDP